MGFFSKLFGFDEQHVFFKSCRYGDHSQVLLMIRKNPNLCNMLDDMNSSALHHAVLSGNPKIIRSILDISLDQVNTQELTVGASPLSEAVNEGSIAITRMLLGAGANPNIQNLRYITPLHIAIDNQHFDIALLLIEYGADLDLVDGFQNTPRDLLSRHEEGVVPDSMKKYLKKK